MDLLGTRQVDPVHQSPQTRMYGFFTHGTVPPSRLYSSGFRSLPDHLRRLPSPTQFRRRLPGHVAFTTLPRDSSGKAPRGKDVPISLTAFPRKTAGPPGSVLGDGLRRRWQRVYRSALRSRSPPTSAPAVAHLVGCFRV